MSKLIESLGLNGTAFVLVFAGMVIGYVIGINVADRIGEKKE